jgi:formylglycine-generating enzyme required for sulfatase activity
MKDNSKMIGCPNQACEQKIILLPGYGKIPLKCPECGTDLQGAPELQPGAEPGILNGRERALSLDGSEMVYVPEGPFIMGSDIQEVEQAYNSAASKYMDLLWVWFERELPRRQMTLPGFWMDITPITCTQYQRFCQATGHRSPEYWQKGDIPEGQAQHPVVGIAWEDAIAYCLWAGKRLPYESEWEKAARGTDGRSWPWGNQYLDDCGNIDNLAKGIQPVGSHPKGQSPYGCLDMAGNVFEWTKDICVPYPGYLETEELAKMRTDRMSSPAYKKTTFVHVFRDGVSIQETQPFQFFKTVVRGGAYGSCAEFCRCAFRLEMEEQGSGSVGFRCVLGEETYTKNSALGQAGRFEESLALAEQSLSLSPNYPTALYNAGFAHSRLGRYPDAIARFQQLVDVWPIDHATWNQLGICQSLQGQHQKAIPYHDAAIFHHPGEADYWYNKGMAVYALAKSIPRENLTGIAMLAAEAAGCFERAHRLGAEDDELKNNLAVANRQEQVIVEYLRGRLESGAAARVLAQLGFARAFPLIQHVWAVVRKYYPKQKFTYPDLQGRGFATTEASTGLTYLKDWGCIEVPERETFLVIAAAQDISKYEPWRSVVTIPPG